MNDIVEKAKMFESEDISRVYILVRYLIDWQKETGGSLEDFLVYIEEHYKKRKQYKYMYVYTHDNEVKHESNTWNNIRSVSSRSSDQNGIRYKQKWSQTQKEKMMVAPINFGAAIFFF